jgi:hypothetical protein
MLKLSAAAGLMAGRVFALAATMAGADGTPKGLALLAATPLDPDGSSDGIKGARVCNTGPQPVAGTYTMQIPPVTLPAGSRLSILARETAAVASASRTVYGGRGISASFADAGITLTTGTLQ